MISEPSNSLKSEFNIFFQTAFQSITESIKTWHVLKKIFNICSRVLEQAISRHYLRLLKQNNLSVGICRR